MEGNGASAEGTGGAPLFFTDSTIVEGDGKSTGDSATGIDTVIGRADPTAQGEGGASVRHRVPFRARRAA